jgi:hypothetical protein
MVIIIMSANPSFLLPASFSTAACAIYSGHRRWWQYELLGQVLVDAIDQQNAVSGHDIDTRPITYVPADEVASYYKRLVQGIQDNIEGLTLLFEQDDDGIAQGDLASFERVAAKARYGYLRAKDLAMEAARLPVKHHDLKMCLEWRLELDGYMEEIKTYLCELTAKNLLIHEGVGEAILARVRQAQWQAPSGGQAELDLQFSFTIDFSEYDSHLAPYAVCLNKMSRVLAAVIQVSTAAMQSGTARPGKICLHQHMFRPDVVAITGRFDTQDSAAIVTPWKMLQSYVCISEIGVSDLRRADACIRVLLESHRASSCPTTYTIDPKEAADLISRVSQLYPPHS